MLVGEDRQGKSQFDKDYLLDTSKAKSKPPKGYAKLEGATTAPRGYTWYHNQKSWFGGEHKSVLVRNEPKSHYDSTGHLKDLK